MPRIPITFGEGLDRETGVMALDVGGMEDLRNVHLMRGKYQVRRGFERVLTFTDDSSNEQTDILAGIAMRGRRAAVYVTYDSVNYKVNVFIGDATGSWAQYLGEWPFLDTSDASILSADNPYAPVVILAEYNSTVFLAHSRNDVDSRAQTYYVYWDTDDQEYKLEALFCRWLSPSAVEEDQKARFRGVTKHLDYLVGWGWGSKYEDRPELVRVSQPGIPLTSLQNGSAFDPLHYWIPGDEGDPTIACQPAAGTLLCFKESETWELFGSSFLNFGQRRMDPLYGMEQPRLAVNVESAVFAWTNEGPRVFSPGRTSEGLEIPLELTLPEPYDLPTKGADEYAFAVYMPVYRSIWWIFGKRVYSLYIRESGGWKWGYQELGFTPMCGFRLPQSGWGLTTAPTGYPSSPSISDIEDEQVNVTVTNNSQDADETLEVWLKPAAGTWALHKSFPVSSAATQEHTLEELKAGWDYTLACRYRRGPYYTFGYESDDPDAWPSGCKTTFTTTLASLPTIDSGVWYRASMSVEQILITVTPPYTGSDYDVELQRGGGDIYTFSDISGTSGYYDTGCAGEADNEYRCRLITPYVNGAWTSVTTVWGGPLAPTIQDAGPDGAGTYTVEWANGLSAETEVYDSLPSELEADVMDNLRSTVAAGETEETVSGVNNSGKIPWVGVRHKLTQYTVDDYSDISKMPLNNPMV